MTHGNKYLYVKKYRQKSLWWDTQSDVKASTTRFFSLGGGSCKGGEQVRRDREMSGIWEHEVRSQRTSKKLNINKQNKTI